MLNKSHKLRVVMVLGFSLPFPGAAWRRIEYFARYLASKGSTVYILGTITPTYLLQRLISKLRSFKRESCTKNSHTPYMVMNVQPYIGSRTSLAVIHNFISAVIIAFMIVLYSPHIVINSIPNIEQVWASYAGARAIGAKIIVDVRDPAEDYALRQAKGLAKVILRFIKKLNFIIYKRVDIVTTVTTSLANYLAKHGITSILVPNGADTNIFRPHSDLDRRMIRKILGIGNDTRVIVFNGYLGEYYKIDGLLEALAKAVKEKPEIKSKIKIVIIGGFVSKSYAKLFIKRIKNLNINDLIINLGVIKSQEKLAQMLAACDIGLIPRISDPFFDYAMPAKFYEYIACGLPIIALTRRSSELANTIIKYDIGYVCEPEDINCLKEILFEISLNKKVIFKYRLNALTYRKLFSREKGAKVIFKILGRLLLNRQNYLNFNVT